MIILYKIYNTIQSINSEDNNIDCGNRCYLDIKSGIKTCNISSSSLNPLGLYICADEEVCPVKYSCIYRNELEGTICPGEKDYINECKDQSCLCLNRSFCSTLSSVIFNPIRIGDIEYYIQQDSWSDNIARTTKPLSNGLINNALSKCSLNEDEVEYMYPSKCIKGDLVQYKDNRFYCIEDIPIRNCDGVIRYDGNTYSCI